MINESPLAGLARTRFIQSGSPHEGDRHSKNTWRVRDRDGRAVELGVRSVGSSRERDRMGPMLFRPKRVAERVRLPDRPWAGTFHRDWVDWAFCGNAYSGVSRGTRGAGCWPPLVLQSVTQQHIMAGGCLATG